MSAFHAVLARCLRDLPSAVTPDAVLLAAYAHCRDDDAFRSIVARHGPMVLRLCRCLLGDRQDAEDAFQATFLVLARRAGSLRAPDRLAAWLFGVARRISRNGHKARARRRRREVRPAPLPPTNPLDVLTARELLAALDGELLRLPTAYRLPLALVYWQGLSQDEVARRLGWSPGSVKGRLERGRKQLAARLTKRGLAPSALLAAPAAGATVPGDLLARTAALAVAPWSKAAPATVLALVTAASPSKLAPAVAMLMAMAGVGLLGFAAGTPQPAVKPKATPPTPAAAAEPRVDAFGDPLPPGALLRLGTSRFATAGRVFGSILWPDRDHITLCTGTAVVKMDRRTGRIVRDFGSFVHVVNGRERRMMVSAWALAPDGRTFAAGARGEGRDSARIWLSDATTGQRLREFAGHGKSVTAVTFRPDGREIVSLGDDGIVRVWSVATGEKLREWTGPNRPLTSLALSPDGRTAATGAAARAADAPVYLWDVTAGELKRTLSGHTASARVAAFSPDGGVLATGGGATVRLWDPATGRELRQLSGHERGRDNARNFVRSLAISPDGRTVASASTDSTVRTWEVDTGRAIDLIPQSATTEAQALAYLDDGTLAICNGQKLLFWDMRERALMNRAAGHEWSLGAVVVAPDRRTVVTVSHDDAIRSWDPATGRPQAMPNGNPWSSYAVVSPDARLVAVTDGSTGETTVRIDDLATGREVRRLLEKGHFSGGSFSPDGRRLATRTPGGSGIVWDLATGTKLCQFPVDGWMGGQDLVFAPDGRTVFAADKDHSIRQWDVGTGTLVREFTADNRNAIYMLAVSPDGRRLAVGWTGEVAVYEVATGQPCWRADPTNYMALAYSPDGALLAGGVAGADGRQVVVWNARTGCEVGGFGGHGGSVMALAFFPDGRRLVSGSVDTTALVWDVAALAREPPTARLSPDEATRLWADLAGEAPAALRAVGRWASASAPDVAVLREHLRPAVVVAPDHVAALVANLDSPVFAVRERAMKDLQQLGPGAAEPLRAAVAKRPSVEVRRRADAVAAAWEREALRTDRALEVLEAVATPDARKLLERLAAGDAAARLTREAQASLNRLGRRSEWQR